MSLKRRQRAEVFPPERGELVEELRQRSALRHRELRKAIELLEGSGLAGLMDDSGARYPVGALAVDQVSDDVEGAPRVAAFVGCDPTLGQAPEERIDGRGRPRQDGNRLLQYRTNVARGRFLPTYGVCCQAYSSSGLPGRRRIRKMFA